MDYQVTQQSTLTSFVTLVKLGKAMMKTVLSVGGKALSARDTQGKPKKFMVSDRVRRCRIFLTGCIPRTTNNLYAHSCLFYDIYNKKSRIQETKHPSTDADSSTNTKKILLVRQCSQKKKKKILRRDFHPLL